MRRRQGLVHTKVHLGAVAGFGALCRKHRLCFYLYRVQRVALSDIIWEINIKSFLCKPAAVNNTQLFAHSAAYYYLNETLQLWQMQQEHHFIIFATQYFDMYYLKITLITGWKHPEWHYHNKQLWVMMHVYFLNYGINEKQAKQFNISNDEAVKLKLKEQITTKSL